MTSATTRKLPPKKRRVRFGRAGGWTIDTARRDWRRRDRLEATAVYCAVVPSVNQRWLSIGAN